jgi:hypothetical protein
VVIASRLRIAPAQVFIKALTRQPEPGANVLVVSLEHVASP